ncbi:AEC family transporter [Clostridium saccharobutylicum]|uniref:Membrane transport protein n=1 Tax=Clostridium saccharobutylicum TaxID=169679 RepID=A0A1S8NC19_CLOSA|nr:AEC family transporter [Clostridium saccharobutylicum]OOM13821.1 membrane transport protein [Clostridium saccharobutylicum]
MGAILIKAFSFVLIIIIGYVLKKLKVFGATDYKIVTKIIMNITLPCALITGFANFKMDTSMLFIVLLGFLCNIIMSFIGYVLARKKDGKEKAFNVLNLAGYNIGCFTLPFVQSFLGVSGVGITSLFDIGNSIMCTGGTYAIASGIAGEGDKQSIRGFLRKILSSVPFDTYLIMFIITVTGIKLPDVIYNITSNLSAGNAFLSMLMIGMVFECKFHKEQLFKVGSLLCIRYLFAVLFAVIIYYFIPFSIEIKHILVILVFGPVSVLSPVFTGRCGSDEGLAGVINSICIPISIIIITSILFFWQIG